MTTGETFLRLFVRCAASAAILTACGLMSRLVWAVLHFGWQLPELVMR
jgi:hypothetical protein